VLNRNNPICSIVSRSEGRIRPRIEILTTSSPKKVVGTGADEDSRWYLNGDGNSGTSPRDPALLYEEGGPLAVVYYGVNNNETIYKLMHHGTTRKLYELVWDGMTLTTNEIDFHG